jgi:D-glycerate 3-kinase
VIQAGELEGTLRAGFGLSTDLGEGLESSGEFPDWELIASGLAAVAEARGCRILGICGSQGSGKSTLARIAVEALRRHGINAASCSIDDFYLTKSERQALARSVHPLLATRGVPGTHDAEWIARVLAGARSGQPQEVPMFDKGLDDRAGTYTVDADLLILEGWCVGVRPEPADRLDGPCNALERDEDPEGIWRRWVNEQIHARYAALWDEIDFWVQLKPPSFDQVFEWRSQQEQALPVDRRMDPRAIRRFIEHYQRLTQWQWACPTPTPGLCIALAADHTVSHVTGYP